MSWGLYISNFTFLVGVAAAAVMLVLPTYILHDVDFKQAVLIRRGSRGRGAGDGDRVSWWWMSAGRPGCGT